MLLIISRNEDRPELESKILAAAFRQSVERGDIDGSRLAHRELVGLLARKSKQSGASEPRGELEHVYASDNIQQMDLQMLSNADKFKPEPTTDKIGDNGSRSETFENSASIDMSVPASQDAFQAHSFESLESSSSSGRQPEQETSEFQSDLETSPEAEFQFNLEESPAEVPDKLSQALLALAELDSQEEQLGKSSQEHEAHGHFQTEPMSPSEAEALLSQMGIPVEEPAKPGKSKVLRASSRRSKRGTVKPEQTESGSDESESQDHLVQGQASDSDQDSLIQMAASELQSLASTTNLSILEGVSGNEEAEHNEPLPDSEECVPQSEPGEFIPSSEEFVSKSGSEHGEFLPSTEEFASQSSSEPDEFLPSTEEFVAHSSSETDEFLPSTEEFVSQSSSETDEFLPSTEEFASQSSSEPDEFLPGTEEFVSQSNPETDEFLPSTEEFVSHSSPEPDEFLPSTEEFVSQSNPETDEFLPSTEEFVSHSSPEPDGFLPGTVPDAQELNAIVSESETHTEEIADNSMQSSDIKQNQEAWVEENEFDQSAAYANIDFGADEQVEIELPDSIAALLALRPPPDPDANNYYRWIGAESTDPFFLVHVCYLNAVRKLLVKQFGTDKSLALNPPDFKRQLKNMGIAFNIIFDPRTRLDYDLRQLGLREPDAGNGLAVPDDARLPDSGGKTRLSFSELIILCRIFDAEQMLAVINAARILQEQNFWDYLAESGHITTVELDSIRSGFHLLCNGLISIAQFEQAFQYVRMHQQQLLEILLAAGWVHLEELHEFANSPDPKVLPEAPKFFEVAVQEQGKQTQEIQVSGNMPSWMDWGSGEETDEITANTQPESTAEAVTTYESSANPETPAAHDSTSSFADNAPEPAPHVIEDPGNVPEPAPHVIEDAEDIPEFIVPEVFEDQAYSSDSQFTETAPIAEQMEIEAQTNTQDLPVLAEADSECAEKGDGAQPLIVPELSSSTSSIEEAPETILRQDHESAAEESQSIDFAALVQAAESSLQNAESYSEEQVPQALSDALARAQQQSPDLSYGSVPSSLGSALFAAQSSSGLPVSSNQEAENSSESDDTESQSKEEQADT